MLRPRLIPTLLIRNGGLVKTEKFQNDKYVGDPINAVRIFNEKQVDEIVIFDIDATAKGRDLDYELIAKLANECRMPMTYGGGVSTVSAVERIISLGVEKVSLSSAAIQNLNLISSCAARVGSQSIVVTLDIRKLGIFGRYGVVTHNAKSKLSVDLMKLIKDLQRCGVGELILNSVDHDGTQKGYDFDLISMVKDSIHIPFTMLGGAGTLGDVERLWSDHGLVGAAAGSLFIFKGRYKAVLINYPDAVDRLEILKKVGWGT
jgi:cyclase